MADWHAISAERHRLMQIYILKATDKASALVVSGDFKALCAFAKVQPTRRQARKYGRGEGAAYALRNRFEEEKHKATEVTA